jgi:putative hydrolase
VASLLAIDENYRREALAGSLERVAPRRFNPEHTAWMPVLREERDGWAFVATYSNTARAHDLHTTHDWVVIRAAQGTREVLHTVVTERRGPLTGFRVIRGRETECAQHYGVVRAPPPPPGT